MADRRFHPAQRCRLCNVKGRALRWPPMPRPALSATRAVAVLNFLAAHPRDSFTLSDLSARLDINLASAHSLLAALTDAGYVVRDARQRTYGLGPTVDALGIAALERHAVIDLARDAARQLAS